MKKLLLATTAVLALALPAAADDITIFATETGGASLAFGPFPGFNSTGSFNLGDFNINDTTASAPPALPFPGLTDSNTINIQGLATLLPHTLTIDVATVGSLTGLQTIQTAFDSVGLTPGWTLQEQVLVNGVPIDSATFTGTGGVGPNFNLADFGVGPSSVIEAIYTITTGDLLSGGIAGAANAGIRVDAVPGPIVGAGLPGLLGLLGFGGWKLRRRKNVSTAGSPA